MRKIFRAMQIMQKIDYLTIFLKIHISIGSELENSFFPDILIGKTVK